MATENKETNEEKASTGSVPTAEAGSGEMQFAIGFGAFFFLVIIVGIAIYWRKKVRLVNSTQHAFD